MMSANLRAFLLLVRWCEGTSDENGYRALYGHRKDKPKLFSNFDDHPRIFFDTPWGKTSAAGAFQMLAATFDDAAAALGLTDFSPESQDQAAVWLVKRRGALHAVEQGDLDNAVHLCNKEWASLPGSPYGQPTRTMAECRKVFEQAGGTLRYADSIGTTVPAPTTKPPQPTKQESPMAPAIIQAVVATLFPLISDLFRARGSKTATRNADIMQVVGDAAPAIAEIAKEVAGGGNEQQAAEAILSDKILQARFRAEVALKWSDLEPFLRFEEESRAAARQFSSNLMSDGPQWRQMGAGLLIGALSLTIVVGGGAMFWQLMDSPMLDPGQKGLILGALIAAFTTTVGFWFGSSRSSQMKDQALVEKSQSQ